MGFNNTRRKKIRSKSISTNTTRSRNRTKTRHRSYSLERNKNIDSEKLGEGGYGIVSRPPAKCVNLLTPTNSSNEGNKLRILYKNKYLGNNDYISKLTEYNSASKEMDFAYIIKDHISNYSEYFCLVEFICPAPSDKHVRIGVDDYLDTYAIMPYGGITLYSILNNEVYIHPKECYTLFTALQKLVKGVMKMHKIHVYHQDIHDQNVLYNFKDNTMRMVDFGLSINLQDVSHNTQTSNNKTTHFSSMHTKIISAMHFDYENLLYYIIKPSLKFILYKLNSIKHNSDLEFELELYSKNNMANKMTYYLDWLHDIPNIKNKIKEIQLFSDFIEDFIRA